MLDLPRYFCIFPALQQKMVMMEAACDVVCAEKP
jgi:hypothetical protein